MVKRYVPLFLAVLLFCVFTSAQAWAAPGQGGNMPYETWLNNLRASATGPVTGEYAARICVIIPPFFPCCSCRFHHAPSVQSVSHAALFTKSFAMRSASSVVRSSFAASTP